MMKLITRNTFLPRELGILVRRHQSLKCCEFYINLMLFAMRMLSALTLRCNKTKLNKYGNIYYLILYPKKEMMYASSKSHTLFQGHFMFRTKTLILL